MANSILWTRHSSPQNIAVGGSLWARAVASQGTEPMVAFQDLPSPRAHTSTTVLRRACNASGHSVPSREQAALLQRRGRAPLSRCLSLGFHRACSGAGAWHPVRPLLQEGGHASSLPCPQTLRKETMLVRYGTATSVCSANLPSQAGAGGLGHGSRQNWWALQAPDKVVWKAIR